MDSINDIYYVWSVSIGNWWGKNGVYTSQIVEAKPFTRDAAVKFCRARALGGQAAAVPVSKTMLDEVLEK